MTGLAALSPPSPILGFAPQDLPRVIQGALQDVPHLDQSGSEAFVCPWPLVLVPLPGFSVERPTGRVEGLPLRVHQAVNGPSQTPRLLAHVGFSSPATSSACRLRSSASRPSSISATSTGSGSSCR